MALICVLYSTACFANASVQPLPKELLNKVEFLDKTVGAVIPKSYMPAIEKGLREAAREGVMTTYQIGGVRMVLTDGKHVTLRTAPCSLLLCSFRQPFSVPTQGQRNQSGWSGHGRTNCLATNSMLTAVYLPQYHTQSMKGGDGMAGLIENCFRRSCGFSLTSWCQFAYANGLSYTHGVWIVKMYITSCLLCCCF